MTGIKHFHQAERILQSVDENSAYMTEAEEMELVAIAQAHATLAVAATIGAIE